MATDPVLLSTLYNPQGEWTGRGPEPRNISAPEGQEAWFTPGKNVPVTSLMESHTGAWRGPRGMDPRGRVPGTPIYGPGSIQGPTMFELPGTVSYRDIPEPAQPAPLMQGLFPTVPTVPTVTAQNPSGVASLDPNLPLPYYGHNVPSALNIYPGYGSYDPTQSALEILAPGSTLLRQGYSLYQPDMTNFLQQEIERLRGGIT